MRLALTDAADDPVTGRRPKYAPEFYMSERIYVREIGNDPAYARASRALVRVLPGVTTEHHSLTGLTEVYVIIRGQAVMHLDGQPDRRIGPGSVVYIKAGQGQSLTNTGSTYILMECICTPRFDEAAYVSLG